MFQTNGLTLQVPVVTSGGSRGGAGGFLPPLFLDQTEARRAEKNFWETTPPYLRVWMTAPPPLSEALDPPLVSNINLLLTISIPYQEKVMRINKMITKEKNADFLVRKYMEMSRRRQQKRQFTILAEVIMNLVRSAVCGFPWKTWCLRSLMTVKARSFDQNKKKFNALLKSPV